MITGHFLYGEIYVLSKQEIMDENKENFLGSAKYVW